MFPLTWAICYLALVPLAAVYYERLPAGSFYDSNIQREAPTQHNVQVIEGLITRALRSSVPTTGWSFANTTVHVSPPSVSVSSISTEPGDVLTMVVTGSASNLPVRGTTHFVGGFFSETYRFKLSELGGFEEAVSGSRKPALAIVVKRTAPTIPSPDGYGLDPPVNALFPSYKYVKFPDSNTAIMYLRDKTYAALTEFNSIERGDPKFASGLFARMTYFSTTVETTLGFGDITPVSTQARLGVAFQAILGVVLIGLFLNAVAFRRRN